MKKGFTLIELLAVIVILAIIALIATPIVLNIINDTRESAGLRSAEMYLKGIEQSIMKANMNTGGSFNPNYCEINENGNLICDGNDKEVIIEVDGEKPRSGNISFKEGTMVAVNLINTNGKVLTKRAAGKIEYSDKSCILGDKDGDSIADVGEVITCAGESFYVIENDNTMISMLSKYKLDAGIIYTDENGYILNSAATGLQSSNVDSTNDFSTTNYWYNNGFVVDQNYKDEGRDYPFVYKSNIVNNREQNTIYPYLKSYQEYLVNEGVDTAESTLISIEQLQNLGCEIIDATAPDATCKNAYNWVSSTSYWTGSAWDDGVALWYVGGKYISADIYDTSIIRGIRPVINMSVNEI